MAEAKESEAIESPGEQGMPDTPPHGSTLAAIAKRHEEIRADKDLKLFIPGYEGLMQVQYRLLPEAEMDRLGKRIEEVKRGEGVAGAWKVEADSLVATCDRILLREGDDYIPFEDENGPIRFGVAFQKALASVGIKVDGATATEIVLNFFSPRTDPSSPTSPRHYPNAMERHTNAIFAWNRGEKEKIPRDLLGG